MKLYNNTPHEAIKNRGEQLFITQLKRNSGESFRVKVNDNFERDVIIQIHTNPMNQGLKDVKMMFLPHENEEITCGCEVVGYDNDKYLVMTEPHYNGIYYSCKIRKMPNDISFNINKDNYNYSCITADGKLYNTDSYTGEINVFEDDDMMALVIKYDKITSSLSIFDDVVIDGDSFKIVSIDNRTIKKYDEDYGIIQIVVLKTIFGEIKCNDVSIRGCLRYSKMKEKIYNSKARQLYTEHNVVDTGDYIYHTFNRDKAGNKQTRTYMVYSEVDMKNEYDTAFCLLCDRKVNLLNEYGKIVEYSLYINDNKSMLRESSVGIVDGKDVSSTWGSIRLDKTTMKLNEGIQRVLVKHYVDGEEKYKAYKITGKDDLSLGGVIIIGLQRDKIDNERDDLVNGIAYNESVEIPQIPNDIEIVGDDELYMDLANEYVINTQLDVNWSADKEWVKITQNNNKCSVFVCENSKLYNMSFILSATVNGKTYTKIIRIIN